MGANFGEPALCDSEADKPIVDKDGQVCCIYRLREGMGPEYDRRHANVWPEVLELIKHSGISDYSIFRRGNLVISVYCQNQRDLDSVALAGAAEIQTRWTESMSHIFEEIVDQNAEPMWAERIFRLR